MTRGPLIACHNAKTGGTTLRGLLKKAFGELYVDLYYAQPFGALPSAEYRRLPLYYGYGQAFSSAELRYLDPAEFWPGARFVTLIRNPIEQVFSAFNHHHRGAEEFATAMHLPEYCENLQAFLDEPRNCNTNVQFFSTLRCQDRNYSLNDRLDVAMEEIAKYDYIGQTDRFNDLVNMMAADYPEVRVSFNKANVNPERKKNARYIDQAEPAVLDMVLERIRWDVEFYLFASRLHRERWAAFQRSGALTNTGAS